MTTRAAAIAYEREHQLEWGGRPMAVVNPHGKAVEDLPVIYGFNNGGGGDWWYAQLIAEDGTGLGGHVCSAEGYMPHDLGCVEGSRPDRHEEFAKHYPDGYRMQFVPYAEVLGHPGLMEAFRLNKLKAAEEAAKELP